MINDADLAVFKPHVCKRGQGNLAWQVMHRVVSSQMRHPLAFLLILFFALGPLQGLLEASEDSRLPACCRRHGAHHCAMSEDLRATLEKATDSLPAFTASATCPSFPGFALGFSTPSHALTASGTWALALLEQAHTPQRVLALVQTPDIRPRSGRAPPSSL